MSVLRICVMNQTSERVTATAPAKRRAERLHNPRAPGWFRMIIQVWD
jgi:hypothetical protein